MSFMKNLFESAKTLHNALGVLYPDNYDEAGFKEWVYGVEDTPSGKFLVRRQVREMLVSANEVLRERDGLATPIQLTYTGKLSNLPPFMWTLTFAGEETPEKDDGKDARMMANLIRAAATLNGAYGADYPTYPANPNGDREMFEGFVRKGEFNPYIKRSAFHLVRSMVNKANAGNLDRILSLTGDGRLVSKKKMTVPVQKPSSTTLLAEQVATVRAAAAPVELPEAGTVVRFTHTSNRPHSYVAVWAGDTWHVTGTGSSVLTRQGYQQFLRLLASEEVSDVQTATDWKDI